MVRRIRGVAFSTRVSPQIGNRMVYAARGIFNRFIPDVHIFIDSKSGPSGGKYELFLEMCFFFLQSLLLLLPYSPFFCSLDWHVRVFGIFM